VKQLAEDFARYVYLPRLKDSSVLVGAVRDGVGLLTWEEESFAFADSVDEVTGRYRGLRGGQLVSLADADSPGLLVKGAIARSQLVADSAKARMEEGPGAHGDAVDRATTPASGTATSVSSKPAAAPPKRFHGTVTLDATRVGLDASRVAENADETPVRVLDPTRDTTRKGYFWVYIGDDGHPDTVFNYRDSRSRDGPAEILKDYGVICRRMLMGLTNRWSWNRPAGLFRWGAGRTRAESSSTPG